MAKKIVRHQEHTEMDVDTGKMQRIVTDQTIGIVDSEPDYIKIYIGTQLCLNNLDPGLAPYIVAFGPYMTYANDSQYQHMVCTNIVCRQGVADTLGVTVYRVDQIIKKLVAAGIFIPVAHRTEANGIVTTKKRRGLYFVNPWVVAKGSWKDVKKLQQKIDFVRGESSYLISDDGGERKITCALPQSYHQMSLDEVQLLEGEGNGKNIDSNTK
jgi:hypothetical protein